MNNQRGRARTIIHRPANTCSKKTVVQGTLQRIFEGSLVIKRLVSELPPLLIVQIGDFGIKLQGSTGRLVHFIRHPGHHFKEYRKCSLTGLEIARKDGPGPNYLPSF